MHVRNGMKERISQSMEEQLNEDVEERGKFFLPVRGRRYSLGELERKLQKLVRVAVERHRSRFGLSTM